MKPEKNDSMQRGRHTGETVVIFGEWRSAHKKSWGEGHRVKRGKRKRRQLPFPKEREGQKGYDIALAGSKGADWWMPLVVGGKERRGLLASPKRKVTFLSGKTAYECGRVPDEKKKRQYQTDRKKKSAYSSPTKRLLSRGKRMRCLSDCQPHPLQGQGEKGQFDLPSRGEKKERAKNSSKAKGGDPGS